MRAGPVRRGGGWQPGTSFALGQMGASLDEVKVRIW